jgi:hypothetical protein
MVELYTWSAKQVREPATGNRSRPAISPAAGVSGSRSTMNDAVTYVCDSCDEEILAPIDVSAGSSQEHVEDHPV